MPTSPRDVFSAIDDPTRRKILSLLAEGDMPVGGLTGHFAISRPAVSRHLRILRETGVVSEKRRGRERVYSLRARPLQDVRLWVAQFDRFWAVKLKHVKIRAVGSG